MSPLPELVPPLLTKKGELKKKTIIIRREPNIHEYTRSRSLSAIIVFSVLCAVDGREREKGEDKHNSAHADSSRHVAP